MSKENEKSKSPIILSINKLMNVFQDSLEAMVPSLEKAQINWESFEDFEEIETICESLFNLIIKNQLEQYIQSKYSKELKMPPYGFYLKNYGEYDCIEVRTDNPEDRYVFVLIESKQGPFDTVMCDKIDEKGNIISRENEFLWENVEFVLKIRND